MARQIRPGQLQENVLYNISASYAVTASYAMNGGGGGVPSGTVSGSEQITALGFVTSSATSSFVLNSQTSSFVNNSATASFVLNSQTASMSVESASFAVTASHLLNNPPPFPFTGDAQITGSLTVSGSNTFTNIGSFSQTGNSTFDGNFSEPVLTISGSQDSLFGSNQITDKLRIGGNPGESFTFKYNTSTSGLSFASPILQISGSGGSGSFNPNIVLGSATSFGTIIGDNVIVPFSFYVGSRHTNPDNQSDTKNKYQFLISGSDGNAGGGVISLGKHGVDPSSSSDILLNGHVQAAGHITASGNISASAASTASFGTYLGDGSQLTGVVSASYAITASHALNAVASATNFTQSLFVTPNGNDGTAAVGDMLNPFHTILAATASSNIGDTIIIYPGTYPSESANIIKDGVNYYFYPGAIVHPTASLSEYIVDIQDPTYPVNVRGAGSFISDDTSYGAIRIQAEECYFEFDTAKTTNNTTNTYNQGGTVDLEPTNASSGRSSTNDIKGNPFYINGKIINTGNFGTYGGALILGRNGLTDYSSLIFEGSIMQLHPTDTRPAIYVASNKTTYDFSVNANVFASASQAVYSDGRGAVRLRGIYSTGDRDNKYAIELTDGYQTHYDIDAHINGPVKLNTGDINNSGGILRGTILTSNTTPDDAAIYINGGGQHKIDNQIFMRDSGGYGIKIETDDAQVEFTGDFNADAGSSYINFCKVTTGKLIFKGSLGSKANRGNGNIINGGHLVIDSFFDNDGSNYPDNAYCFQLSAGTLEINNKVTHAYTAPGSGIVDMTGGYLKLNGAELVQLNGTGSFAYGVNLNGGSHSGSILNNSFTNLTPFGPGAFTNEITGGGTLFYSDKLY